LQRNFEMGPIAYLRTMQACYPHLKASGEGRVINFGSMAGVIGLVSYGPYNMAKEAVRALTRTAARMGRRQDHREQHSARRRYMGRCRGKCAGASKRARPLWVAGGRRGAGRPLPREQGCAVFDGLQPDPRWRLNHRQRALEHFHYWRRYPEFAR
jgi:short chain dehydrogenase